MKKILLFAIALICALTALGQSKEVALGLFKENKFEEAAVILEKLYKRDPSEENYKLLLACYGESKAYADAEKLVKKHQKRNRDSKLYIDLGYFQQLQKKPEEAKQSYRKALDRIATNPGLAYPISEHFSQYGLYQYALEAYEIAERVNPNLAFHYQKGLIYAELGDMENMINEYLLLIEQSPSYYENIRIRMSRNISTDPEAEVNQVLRKQLIVQIQETQNPLFTKLLVWLYVEEEQYAKAFRQLTALDKRGNNQERTIFNLGEKAQKIDDFEVARNCFDYLIKKGRNGAFYEDAVYANLVTQRMILQANPDADRSAFRKLLQAHYAALPELRGDERYVLIERDIADVLYFNMDQSDSAMATLNRTIARFENTYQQPVGRCKMLLGDMLLAEGQSVDAIFKYMEVERAFKGSTLGDEAKYMKGMVAFYTYDFTWALTQFEALKSSTTKLISNDALQMALLITDNSVEDTLFQGLTYYAKAEFYDFRNMPDSALSTLQDLLDVFPNHAIKEEARLFQARILNGQAKYREAAHALELMLAGGGDIWADDALMLLGEIYAERIGDIEKAMLAYEKILFEHPGSTYIPEARRRYRKLRGDNAVN
jgi:tetratricopeptide (TPR) repeat protein